MTNLYKILETNTDETKKQDTKKFDFLFDLEGNSYKISDIENAKLFICACGTGDIYVEKEEKQECITLNDVHKTLYVDKNISVEKS